MVIKLTDFNNCISLVDYLRAHGVNPNEDEADEEGLEMLIMLLHQSYNTTTFIEERDGVHVWVFNRDWMELFTPLLSQGEAVLQKVTDVIDRSGIDLREHICNARRVTYEYWAEESACFEVIDFSHKAIMRGIRRAQRDYGVPSFRCAILDRETDRISVQPEYPCWLLETLNRPFYR